MRSTSRFSPCIIKLCLFFGLICHAGGDGKAYFTMNEKFTWFKSETAWCDSRCDSSWESSHIKSLEATWIKLHWKNHKMGLRLESSRIRLDPQMWTWFKSSSPIRFKSEIAWDMLVWFKSYQVLDGAAFKAHKLGLWLASSRRQLEISWCNSSRESSHIKLLEATWMELHSKISNRFTTWVN